LQFWIGLKNNAGIHSALNFISFVINLENETRLINIKRIGFPGLHLLVKTKNYQSFLLNLQIEKKIPMLNFINIPPAAFPPVG
jgi:hypothetical protein